MQRKETNTVMCLLLVSVLIGVAGGGCDVGSGENELNIRHEAESAATTVGSMEVTANIEITDIPDALSAFERSGFSKYVSVFGVHIFSTSRTPDDKLLHVANVMAQYLDNDEDGVPDNLLVLSHLLSRDAYLVFPADEEDFEALNPDDWHEAGYHCGQFQHAEETRPDFLIDGEIRAQDGQGYDASLEEVLHLITQHGYANAYPSVFAEEKGSAIANCLDDARGGYFRTVPTDGPHYGYPEGSWFHYDDETCEYGCMNTEYFYWALTSILGTQDYEGRSDALKNEWELNTRDLVKSGDPNIYAILTNPQYKLPTRAPDGNYHPSALPVTAISLFAVENERGDGEDENGNNAEDLSILVEAFVVEVKLSALYESVADRLVKESKSESIRKIIWCLEDNKGGKITGGAKLAVMNDRSGETAREDSEHIDSENSENGAAEVIQTKNKIQFEAEVHILHDGRIAVKFKFLQDFTEEIFSNKDGKKQEITNTRLRDWGGEVSVEPGRPSIVGETKNNTTAAFLVLRADVVH